MNIAVLDRPKPSRPKSAAKLAAKQVARSQRAARRAEQQRRAEAEREAADEAIAPAIQRLGVVDFLNPRLIRDGNTFRVASPIAVLFVAGKKREGAGLVPTVNRGHLRAADRLQRAWEACRTVTAGTARYGDVSAGGDCALSQTVPRAMQHQFDAQREVSAVQGALGPLWGVVLAVALEGLDVRVWAAREKRDERAAYGYLTGALDALVGVYRLVDEGRR